MITDELINEVYIRSIINRDRTVIYKTQADVVRANFHGTGRLARFLTSMPFSFVGNTYWFRILPYLRYLDIKYRGQFLKERRQLALYNRVVWGVLYNETLPDILYGLTQDIKEGIKRDLERAEELEQYDKSW